MLKNLLIVLLALFGIVAGIGYYVYVNRAVLTDKLVNYAMSNLTENSSKNDNESSTWADTLMRVGMSSLQKSMQNAATKQPSDNQTKTGSDGLATMADMFANATNSDSDDFGQMAQALLRGFGSSVGSNASSLAQREVGHDINARDSKGRTLLMNVCRIDASARVVNMIIKYGADVNAVDNKGRSALMYAVALNKNPEVVSKLLDSGANTKIVDEDGNSVFNYVTEDKIREVLQKYMR